LPLLREICRFLPNFDVFECSRSDPGLSTGAFAPFSSTPSASPPITRSA
jgi:hypothetical protein